MANYFAHVEQLWLTLVTALQLLLWDETNGVFVEIEIGGDINENCRNQLIFFVGTHFFT